MARRLPASQRTREELTSLIEGRLSTGSAKDELVKLATRLIVDWAENQMDRVPALAADLVRRQVALDFPIGRCVFIADVGGPIAEL